MIIPNQRCSEKHKFVINANQYLRQINFGTLPINQIGAVTEFVNALYENNLWKKFIAIYPFAGVQNIDQNSLNLIDPFKYKISWVGSVQFNNFGIIGKGGYGITNIPANLLKDFRNIHLSAYVRTSILNTSGNGRLIGINTKAATIPLLEQAAMEINFNKNDGIIGYVYNILNNRGGFGFTLAETNANHKGFFIANNFSSLVKDAKCYLNGSVFGRQFQLLPTEINPNNTRRLTIFGNGYDTLNNNLPLRDANVSFISVGYGLTENDIYNFSQIVETFQAAMDRSIM